MNAALSETSLSTFLLRADIVVQAVVALLVLSSAACWAIILEKIVRLRRLRQDMAELERFAREGTTAPRTGLADHVLRAAEEERAEGSPADLRARLEAAMRGALLAEVRRHETGLSFLATVASTAPFVGLFGTVWGIMRSFSSIADSRDTSLAAVAPGIAEALFATAIGLAVAIPAVVGYNQIRAGFTRAVQRLGAAISALARTGARTRDDGAAIP